MSRERERESSNKDDFKPSNNNIDANMASPPPVASPRPSGLLRRGAEKASGLLIFLDVVSGEVQVNLEYISY